METVDILLFVATLIVMMIGLAGSILPVMPGTPIIWAAAFVYAIVTDFEAIGKDYLIWFGVLTLLSQVLDWLAGIYGARRLGATRWGMLGAFIGTVVGFIIGSIVGLILVPLIGAIAFELLAGKRANIALKAGFGTFLGFIAGVVMKVGLGVVMVVVFIYRVVKVGF